MKNIYHIIVITIQKIEILKDIIDSLLEKNLIQNMKIIQNYFILKK